jgi:hypothetical protein
MEHAQAVILEKCVITIAEIAAKLGINVGLAHALVYKELQFSKICSRWLPKHLTG